MVVKLLSFKELQNPSYTHGAASQSLLSLHEVFLVSRISVLSECVDVCIVASGYIVLLYVCVVKNILCCCVLVMFSVYCLAVYLCY